MIHWQSRSNHQSEVTAPPVALPSFIWKWLTARGITEEQEITNFLNPSLKDLTDPLKLDGMSAAVERLKVAWKKEEKICIYGDYDLDGSSGIALLVRGLESLGFENVSYYQPSRFEEGYGIHRDALKAIKDRGDSIVISVDCGITAIEEAKYARELGLDLIITDHHLPQETLPQAYCVINPNKGTCTSGLGHLSGVGVAFYLVMALKRELSVVADLKGLLDFFTIGTVTDMVPLIKENRTLVKHGLKILSNTQRPGLKALIEHLGLNGRSFETQDVGFGVGPKLNALSRLEKGIRPLDIFLCEDKKTAEILVEKVISLNNERKKLQEDLLEKISAQLTEDEFLKPAIVLSAEGHAGVVGLVATKIAQLTNKPTFITAWFNGEGIGSARGAAADILPNVLNHAASFLDKHGGHSQAAGFSLMPEQFDGFKAKVLEHYGAKETRLVTEVVEYDFEASVSDFTDLTMNWLTHLGPFGIHNPQPLFKLKDFEIISVQWMKSVHLKVQFTDGKSRIEGVSFFAKDKLKESAKEIVSGNHDNIELLVEPSFNYFNGRKSVQLLIREIKITTKS